MIIHLVDANGHIQYSGQDTNPKVHGLESGGLVRVAEPPPAGARHRWAGGVWVPDPVPPTLPENTDLKPEDMERLFRLLGATPAQTAQAKRDRGKPVP